MRASAPPLARHALARCLHTLSSTDRQCLFARSRGLSLREIADLLGVAPRDAADAIAHAVEQVQRRARD